MTEMCPPRLILFDRNTRNILILGILDVAHKKDIDLFIIFLCQQTIKTCFVV